jgi:hypothetical protein
VVNRVVGACNHFGECWTVPRGWFSRRARRRRLPSPGPVLACHQRSIGKVESISPALLNASQSAVGGDRRGRHDR